MTYLARAVDNQLDQLLPHAAAIAVEGPKGVGKTETARRRASTVLQLDTAEGAGVLAADPTFSAERPGTILIDEWQRHPESWDYVRRAVDEGAEPGRFLLTGSATTPTAEPAGSSPCACGRWRCLNGRGRSRR